MDADHILNLAMTAGVLCLIATPVLAIILAGLVGWGRGLADRNAAQAVTISGLERRLADVTAIRAKEPVNLAEHPDHAAMRYIEQLRAGEGDSVTVLCDDPEAESTAARLAVECVGAWTQWEPRRFYGESVLQCLAKAAVAQLETPRG